MCSVLPSGLLGCNRAQPRIYLNLIKQVGLARARMLEGHSARRKATRNPYPAAACGERHNNSRSEQPEGVLVRSPRSCPNALADLENRARGRNSNSSPLSIGYCVNGWELPVHSNGVNTYVATIVPSMKQMGVKVTILARRAGERTDDNTVYDIGKTWRARSATRRVLDGLSFRATPRRATEYFEKRMILAAVRYAVAELGVQIIEVEDSAGTARWVRQAAPIRVCVRLHGPWFLNGAALGVPQDDKFHDRIRKEGLGIRAAMAVTAPSMDVLQRVRDFYGIALPDAEVIPNPVRRVPAAERWRLEDCDQNQILFIGRFDRHKGGDLIIEAFARVLREIPEARLCFVGADNGRCVDDDGRRWNIENFIRYSIPGALETGRVVWVGQQPNATLGDFRRKSLVSVVCSRYENLPYTAIEAAAMGCPTIGARVGGIAEVLQDGVSGLLHRAGDAADLAAKIIVALKNPNFSAELGRCAAINCERRFCPEALADRTIDFYRRMLDG